MVDSWHKQREELAARLQALDAVFERQMRARGFNPEQAENVALTSELASLYTAREAARTELEEMSKKSAAVRGENGNVTETDRILDQLKRVYEGDAWHGPSVRETLEGVSAERAAARPIAGAHSIWELVLHLGAWKSAIRRRLEGDRAQLADEENWPPITETNEAAWSEAKNRLERAHESLVAAFSLLDDARLDEPILADMPSIYVTVHGVIQHELYHAGQIAILKRAAEAAN